MVIHVVKPGETLWTIGRMYKIPTDKIVAANGISTLPHLVIGQALVIPTQSKVIGSIYVNGFIQPSTSSKEKAIIANTGKYLTYITPFSHHINASGGLEPIDDKVIKAEAKKYKVKPMLSVTNLNESNFDTPLIDSFLKNKSKGNLLISNILKELRYGGYGGVIIDFERIPPEDRELYNEFLTRAAASIHKEGYLIATALAPKVYDIKAGAWHGAHDYAAHGRIVDFVIIMTYEWGWSGGADQLKQ